MSEYSAVFGIDGHARTAKAQVAGDVLSADVDVDGASGHARVQSRADVAAGDRVTVLLEDHVEISVDGAAAAALLEGPRVAGVDALENRLVKHALVVAGVRDDSGLEVVAGAPCRGSAEELEDVHMARESGHSVLLTHPYCE